MHLETARLLYTSTVIGYWFLWTLELSCLPKSAAINKHLDKLNLCYYLGIPLIAYYDGIRTLDSYTTYLIALVALFLTHTFFVCVVVNFKRTVYADSSESPSLVSPSPASDPVSTKAFSTTLPASSSSASQFLNESLLSVQVEPSDSMRHDIDLLGIDKDVFLDSGHSFIEEPSDDLLPGAVEQYSIDEELDEGMPLSDVSQEKSFEFSCVDEELGGAMMHRRELSCIYEVSCESEAIIGDVVDDRENITWDDFVSNLDQRVDNRADRSNECGKDETPEFDLAIAMQDFTILSQSPADELVIYRPPSMPPFNSSSSSSTALTGSVTSLSSLPTSDSNASARSTELTGSKASPTTRSKKSRPKKPARGQAPDTEEDDGRIHANVAGSDEDNSEYYEPSETRLRMSKRQEDELVRAVYATFPRSECMDNFDDSFDEDWESKLPDPALLEGPQPPSTDAQEMTSSMPSTSSSSSSLHTPAEAVADESVQDPLTTSLRVPRFHTQVPSANSHKRGHKRRSMFPAKPLSWPRTRRADRLSKNPPRPSTNARGDHPPRSPRGTEFSSSPSIQSTLANGQRAGDMSLIVDTQLEAPELDERDFAPLSAAENSGFPSVLSLDRTSSTLDVSDVANPPSLGCAAAAAPLVVELGHEQAPEHPAAPFRASPRFLDFDWLSLPALDSCSFALEVDKSFSLIFDAHCPLLELHD